MDTEGGIGGGPSWETPVWAVRIRRGDGTVVGAGILVEPEWVLTCARVMTEGDRATAEFVGVPGRPRAAVAGGAYATAGAGGVALLRLTGPGPPGAAGPLYRRSVPRREVRIYGFPGVDGEGAWLPATTTADGGGPDGRVRLATGEPVPPGFGGAGVADAGTGELLGLALGAADPDTDPRTYMSPAEVIVRQLPRAVAWTRGPVAVDERLWAARPGTDLLSSLPSPAAAEPAAPPAPLDEDFATRLADWFRGGTHHGGDRPQVKISLVRAGDPVRETALRRAVVLADRELRLAVTGPTATGPDTTATATGPGPGGAPGAEPPPTPYLPYATDPMSEPPGTVPPPGSLDLAVDAAGRSARWIAERVAERMGPGPGRGVPAADRVVAARQTLTLVVVGVDEAADPGRLLGLLARFMAHGDRMLLVFRTAGEHFARAQSQLVIEPAQQRQARIASQLAEITGPLARALQEKQRLVRADTGRALDALLRAYAVQEELAGTGDVIAGLGQDPNLVRYERVVGRAAARLRQTVARLNELLDRRAELLGRLTSYHALRQEAVDAEEEVAVEELYARAYDLLRAKPCDVAAAESAVDRYTDVIDGRGAAGPGEPEGHGGDGRRERPTEDGDPWQ